VGSGVNSEKLLFGWFLVPLNY